MDDKAHRLLAMLSEAPVLPTLAVGDRAVAVAAARALVEGGLTSLEVSSAGEAGLECLRAIAGEVEGAHVAAGNVTASADYEAAFGAGASFAIGPMAGSGLIDAAADLPLPFLPGVTSAGEAMELAEQGYRLMRFLPAEPAGGVPYVKAMSVGLPAIGFCPGDIGQDLASAYLSLANVVCVGGDWVAPRRAVAVGDWSEITRRARQAVNLGGASR